MSRKNNVYRLLRIARDMRVKDVAEAVGVTRAYISAIEAGEREPSLDKVLAYAKSLRVDENTFFSLRELCKGPGEYGPRLLAVLERIVALDKKGEEF